MNINVTKKTLSGALDLLARVIPARSANPALTGVLIETSERGLTLTGTNLEVDLSLDIPAEVGFGNGERLLLPAHLFHGAVKRAAGALIELQIDGLQVVMRSGGGTNKFQALTAENYALLAFATGGTPLSPQDFHRALTRVMYASGEEGYQAVFRGVKITLDKTGGRAVCSDGYRVATCTFPAPDDAAGGMLIPARSLAPLLPLFEAASELHVRSGDEILHLTTDTARANVRLLYGDYPDWERVVPKNIVMTARVAKTDLVEALQRAALFTDATANNRLELLFADGKVRVTAENEHGQADEFVNAEIAGTEPALSISMNNKFLLAAANSIDGELELRMSGSSTPMIITSSTDASAQAIVVALSR